MARVRTILQDLHKVRNQEKASKINTENWQQSEEGIMLDDGEEAINARS